MSETKRPIDRWCTSARTVFGEGECILLAYDTEGRILVGIKCKPKSAYKWARNGVTKADKRRLATALQSLKEEE